MTENLRHADRPLIAALRRDLRAAANPEKAPDMQAYMKSEMPYAGVMTGPRREILRAHTRGLPTFEAWRDTILALFREATLREERYFAIDLAIAPAARAYREPAAALPLADELIVTGAWWDLVDPVATRMVGDMLQHHREPTTQAMREWAADPDHWRRRTAIICQVRAKQALDTDLLAHAIAPSIGERDFFLRKGIGWALREHAATDPDWVEAYVAAHPELSPLSRREAGKGVARARAQAPLIGS